MRIFAKTLTSYRIAFDIQDTTTVLEVKGMISSRIAFPEYQQRLIFEGRELRDRRTLNSYNVGENALLLIIRRGHLRDFSQSIQEVFDSVEELLDNIVGSQLYEDTLALQRRVLDSVTELQNEIEDIEDYEETLDEAPYGPWSEHMGKHWDGP
jgi:hypothetical protein